MGGYLEKRIALIMACTKRKHGEVQPQMRFHSLGCMSTEQLVKEWAKRIKSTKRCFPVDKLYCGGGWAHSIGAYTKAQELFGNVSLYVLSAGLGLLSVENSIPPYSATFAPDPDQIAKHIIETDSVTEAHRKWWQMINMTLNNKPQNLSGLHYFDYIFLSASADYLKAINNDLATLAEILGPERLSVTSVGVSPTSLDATVQQCLLPIDISIETILPGPRSTINQRTLHWIFDIVLPNVKLDISLIRSEIDKQMVACHMAQASQLKREINKMNDEEIIKWIQLQISGDQDISKYKLLRNFRQSRSCEQKRFSKLIDVVRHKMNGATS